jgi:chorismate synthase
MFNLKYNNNFKYTGQTISILVWNKDYNPWKKLDIQSV